MDCSLTHTDAIQNRYLLYLCERQNYIHLDLKLLYQMMQSRNGRHTDRGIKWTAHRQGNKTDGTQTGE
jgi:hypothetical protein